MKTKIILGWGNFSTLALIIHFYQVKTNLFPCLHALKLAQVEIFKISIHFCVKKKKQKQNILALLFNIDYIWCGMFHFFGNDQPIQLLVWSESLISIYIWIGQAQLLYNDRCSVHGSTMNPIPSIHHNDYSIPSYDNVPVGFLNLLQKYNMSKIL